jgi:hypothetical protein
VWSGSSVKKLAFFFKTDYCVNPALISRVAFYRIVRVFARASCYSQNSEVLRCYKQFIRHLWEKADGITSTYLLTARDFV